MEPMRSLIYLPHSFLTSRPASNMTIWSVKTLFVLNTSTTWPRSAVRQENGNLLISCESGILGYDYETQAVFLIAGSPDQSGFRDGSLLDARFNAPREILILSTTKLLLVDVVDHRLRLLDIGWDRTFSTCTWINLNQNGNSSNCGVAFPRSLLALENVIYIGGQ